MIKSRLSFLLVLAFLLTGVANSVASNPKREFRGAWLHVISTRDFAKRTTEQNKVYFRNELDKLQEAGVNAVVFQIRPFADALYHSDIEPWSAYLTGVTGRAPETDWDPLQFMIEECHARGMELHAWLNPYRSVTLTEKLPADHQTKKEHWRFITFHGRYYYDPGLPENRAHINKVVKDIVTRYDVDAIHMDDYFYPYPKQGLRFADDASYRRFGNGMNLEDWRRDNVNKLIEELSETIHSTKPWVRFGISPFGIWRNKKSDPDGSDTNGLQNYDNLYADVILWAKNGWIDYQVPQLYWDLDLKIASSRKLADWWNDHAYDRHLYIGQDVERTMNYGELKEKIDISRRLPNVQGNVWWPAVSVTKDYKNVIGALKKGPQSTIALTPEYPWLAEGMNLPEVAVPSNLTLTDGVLSWEYADNSSDDDPRISDVNGAVIYSLDSDKIGSQLDDPANIVAVVRGDANFCEIAGKVKPGTWLAVTCLDRINRESQPSKPFRYNPK